MLSSTLSSLPVIASTTILSTSAQVTASATTSAAASGATGLSTRALNAQMNIAYYPDWIYWTLPPSAIDYSQFDCLDYAFGLLDSNYNIILSSDNSGGIMRDLVSHVHAAGKLVRLSIGGWTGSQYFSAAMSTAENRQLLVNNLADVYHTYNLDGIDVDWEYPGIQGAGYNGVASDDSANYILFFQLLRKTLPSDALISSAAQVWPFADANGNPMRDVSAFAAVLDWVLVMNYDVWGSSSTPGPNAPLSDGCGTSLQPLANAYAAVSSWTTAGLAPSQIMLGVPGYGYLQKSDANALVQKKRSLDARSNDVELRNSDGGTTNGQLGFSSLVSQGALVKDWSGAFVGAGGFTREWDSCSSTPWLKSIGSGQIVTYDDPQSLSLKAQFAKQAGLRGCNMWDAGGDTKDWDLQKAIRSGLGI